MKENGGKCPFYDGLVTPLGGPLGGMEDEEKRGEYRAGEEGAVRVIVVSVVGL